MDISADYLRGERSRVAVLKAELARIRSKEKCLFVLVLEGQDDLPVYEAWINRIDPSLRWEPIIAKGKKNSLLFREMMLRDQTGASVCTFFVIDHDYDGLREYVLDESIYVLPAYSIENFLTQPTVVESILKVDLRLVGDLELRNSILEKYIVVQNGFMLVMRPLCERLFAAKRCDVGNIDINEECLRPLRVSIDAIEVNDIEAFERLVVCDGEIDQLSLNSAREYFESLDLALWIRGKYLHKLLKKWVSMVHEDISSANSLLTPGGRGRTPLNPGFMDISALASKSPLPPGFDGFIARAAKRCKSTCVS